MKRRITYFLTALALLGTFAVSSPGSVSASCEELDAAIDYHAGEGNIGYALQLATWADGLGCDVTRDRAPTVEHIERRLVAYLVQD
jgi:hypothetical protein